MRVVVTGGAGMVGSHAAEFFAQRGHEVVVFDALIRSYLAGASQKSVEHNWNRLQANPRIRCVKGDVRNWEAVQQVLEPQVDAVIHAAGQPGVGFSMQHPLEDFQINALGTLHVLEAARQRCPKAKVVFCSTNKVYGANVDQLPITALPTRYAFSGGASGVSEALPTDLKPSQFQPTFASMSRFLNEGEKGERDEAPLTQEEFVRRPREDITASITKRDEPVNEYFVFGERPVVLTTQTKLARLSLVRFRWNSFGDPILVAESNTIHSVAPNELENDER